MSIEEKQSFQTYQDSSYFEYPDDEKNVSKLIGQFYKSNTPIELIGTGSKRKIGKPLQCSRTISLSKLNGIIEYFPEELYIKVKACTPIKLIEEELKKNKQHLAFEPVDLGHIFSGKNDSGTAAGQVSCNISGPRRFKVGSIRDHVLGFRGVNGRGDIIKSGGVVVKNVTGYDLSKLICGSYGTLVALTEITLKVLPAPEASKTLVIHNLKLESSVDLLDKAIGSSNDISGATFLPTEPKCSGCKMNIEETFKLNDLKYAGSLTAIRIEGSKNSISERMENLKKELKVINYNHSILEVHQSEIFWNKIKNLETFSSTKNNILRIVIPPSKCIQLIFQFSHKFKYYLDWGGSLIWMEACDLTEEMFDSIRKKVVRQGGYVSMIKTSEQLPLVEEVFTIDRNLFNLSQSVKKSFDPKRILNPGKMYTGIYMETNFSEKQLKDKDNKSSEKILRKCVHCGFCNATCPTYQLLGDELDGPRGRIYLIKDMLEKDKPANDKIVKHIDRCLSCYSCMTTCPSGVNYMHLIDHGRKHIEKTYKRPFKDRFMRDFLSIFLTKSFNFRLIVILTQFLKPFRFIFPKNIGEMIKIMPKKIPKKTLAAMNVYPVQNKKKAIARVALLTGCVQKVISPQINEATIRLLNRHHIEVIVPKNINCCGSLDYHLGKSDKAYKVFKNNILTWYDEYIKNGLDAIISNTSGCGTTLKDYGFICRSDNNLKKKAKKISELTKDIAEYLDENVKLNFISRTKNEKKYKIAYHSACSMQHGQKVHDEPINLIKKTGNEVLDIPEGNICCGSAGTYNLLQSEIAKKLLKNKILNIEKIKPQIISTGNIGCITQIAQATKIPILHTIEIIDWYTGGPKPKVLRNL